MTTNKNTPNDPKSTFWRFLIKKRFLGRAPKTGHFRLWKWSTRTLKPQNENQNVLAATDFHWIFWFSLRLVDSLDYLHRSVVWKRKKNAQQNKKKQNILFGAPETPQFEFRKNRTVQKWSFYNVWGTWKIRTLQRDGNWRITAANLHLRSWKVSCFVMFRGLPLGDFPLQCPPGGPPRRARVTPGSKSHKKHVFSTE